MKLSQAMEIELYDGTELFFRYAFSDFRTKFETADIMGF